MMGNADFYKSVINALDTLTLRGLRNADEAAQVGFLYQEAKRRLDAEDVKESGDGKKEQ